MKKQFKDLKIGDHVFVTVRESCKYIVDTVNGIIRSGYEVDLYLSETKDSARNGSYLRIKSELSNSTYQRQRYDKAIVLFTCESDAILYCKKYLVSELKLRAKRIHKEIEILHEFRVSYPKLNNSCFCAKTVNDLIEKERSFGHLKMLP